MIPATSLQLASIPYVTPSAKPGDALFCLGRGRLVMVHSIKRDRGKIAWPVARGRGKPSLILTGSLVIALTREKVLDTCRLFPISAASAKRYRKILKTRGLK